MELRGIDNTYWSYNKIIRFYERHKNLKYDYINLNLKGWFQASICAMLGALLFKLQSALNTVNLEVDNPRTQNILERNGFFSFFNHPKRYDYYNTVISYQVLSPGDDRYFNEYIFTELLSKSDLPTMTTALKKNFAKSIYEIFLNARMHSYSEKIFACGQYFPNKQIIEFMIADIGIGIPESIYQRFGKRLKAKEAIVWAIENGHTTKQGVSGGIGLALLKEFIEQNNGRIQIISKEGFWEYNEYGVEIREFDYGFPGTVVNICVRTDDDSSYSLASEIDEVF